MLSFKSDHPRHAFANIIRTALFRAFRYSSTLQEFNHERQYIQLILLYNDYPVRYIRHHFLNFFSHLSIGATYFAHIIQDEHEYLQLRHQVLAKVTPGEHARASRIASQIDQNKPLTTTDSLVKLEL
ncbi:unnamed protein product [Rotaria magnacalcarata]|uniref:Helix-turn-helix domain-containing protein n=1 Tax=Rotaria magnacalcarata TaxID=392030 RepID=A0A816NG39_9BILA|nr:unnamed protein product [Rotaria magnacalcarata]CAF2066881.1 unnamed protein product [Rotaria magnacalcarata]CAF4186470.1 unnamed protein product [Rotaria magnacalcarata]CAF4189866.1 unnamed protein product [Rotaria magnacalcarata]